MKRTPNWKDLDLAGKCGSCNYYQQIMDRYNKETARGHCHLRNKQYKQRTDTCLKYKGR